MSYDWDDWDEPKVDKKEKAWPKGPTCECDICKPRSFMDAAMVGDYEWLAIIIMIPNVFLALFLAGVAGIGMYRLTGHEGVSQTTACIVGFIASLPYLILSGPD